MTRATLEPLQRLAHLIRECELVVVAARRLLNTACADAGVARGLTYLLQAREEFERVRMREVGA